MSVAALAIGVALASLGIARAQTTTTAVDSAVTTNAATSTGTPPMMRGGHRGPGGSMLDDQAKKFNMTTAELQTELQAGKPMYQIAAEHGVTYAAEQAQRLTDLKTRLDDMVKVKYMTQAEADAAYQNAKDNPQIGPGVGGLHLMK